MSDDHEISPDLLELFEFDEFDSFDEHLYQVANQPVEPGVPLSVELSESLSKSNSQELSDAQKSPDAFVKAPEIFLRIENNSANEASSSSSSSKKLSIDKKSNSLESTDSNDAQSLANRDECVELQYENEFSDSNEENDCDVVDSAFNPQIDIDSDYEQLLFEGIID